MWGLAFAAISRRGSARGRPRRCRRRPPSRQAVERGGKQCLGQGIDARGFAFARTANAKHERAAKSGFLLLEPGRRPRRRAWLAGIDDQEWFAVLPGPVQGARGPDRGRQTLAVGDEEGGITVAHVPFRALQG